MRSPSSDVGEAAGASSASGSRSSTGGTSGMRSSPPSSGLGVPDSSSYAFGRSVPIAYDPFIGAVSGAAAPGTAIAPYTESPGTDGVAASASAGGTSMVSCGPMRRSMAGPIPGTDARSARDANGPCSSR